MLRFSANLGFLWSTLPLLDRVEAAARAGFAAVECHSPFEVEPAALAAACRRHGVSLLAFNSDAGDPVRGEFGFAALPGREPDFAASIERAIDYAAASGAPAIHVLAGVTGQAPADPARTTFVANLQRAADAAAAAGLTLLLEPLNTRDKPGYFYATADDVVARLKDIGRPNVRLLFDVYHVAASGPDVLAVLERTAPWIGHIQVAGVPARAEPDEGTVNYREVFRTIREIGYAGWIGCEYRPRTTPEAGLGWIDALGGRESIG